MSAVTTTPARTVRPTAGSLRRLAALSRAETLLLLRNRTALMYALAMPVAFVVLFAVVGGIGREDSVGQEVAAGVLVTLLTISLVFVVFYNITSAYVARREDRVLQRLLTGASSRLDVLLAPAVPPTAIVLAQIALGYGAVRVLVDDPGMVNPVLVLVAALGGTAVMVALAAATAGTSKTVESVQLTTLPVIVVLLPFAGMFPLPEGSVLETVAAFTPLHAATDLMWLGLTGGDGGATFAGTFAEAGQPIGVLVLWTALAAWAARRWMRWAPRR